MADRSEVNALESQIKNLSDAVKSIEAIIATKKRTNGPIVKTEIIEETNEKDRKIAELSNQIEELQLKLQASEAENKAAAKSFRTIVAMKNNEIEKLHGKITVDDDSDVIPSKKMKADNDKYVQIIDQLKNQLERLQTEIRELNGSPLQSDLVLRMALRNCSQIKLNNTYTRSDVCKGYQWSLHAKKLTVNGVDKLSLGVGCNKVNNPNSAWSCVATTGYRLICRTDPAKTISHVDKYLMFTTDLNRWTYADFTDWNRMMDEANGFIKDDIVIVEVGLNVYP